MLKDQDLDQWFKAFGANNFTRQTIQKIRSSEPSRRVQSGRRNVSGSYPSKKMGVTVQFESHRVELARIYELEHDPNVLEYYDQPPPIELRYESKSGRRSRHQYTPDFFVIRANSAGWEECKTIEELEKLTEKSPNRYVKNDEGQWRCPPGEEYAAQYGLTFRVWTNVETNWIFQQNFIWLEDYLRADVLEVDTLVSETVISLVQGQRGITLSELLSHPNMKADDIYNLIATQELYVDLYRSRLSEPDKTRVFLDRETARAYDHISEINPRDIPVGLQTIQISIGPSILWNDEPWEIINTGTTATRLLGGNDKIVELPNQALNELIQKGRITGLQATKDNGLSEKVAEILGQASPKDIETANYRYEEVQPYLDKSAPTCPSRTMRRWRNNYWNAEEIYGNGYIGLLPKYSFRGNRIPKMDDATRDFMANFIEQHYENLKQRGIVRVYQAFVEACEQHDPRFNPPCRKTFTCAIKKRSGYKQTKKRMGRRAAIQKDQFYWELELTTPRHGSRPFEIVHIDHTQLDIELISSLASLTTCNFSIGPEVVRTNLGRPWATFMVDAYSRRLLAVYITYEDPSYRSCMMVLRICVQRFKRFPQTIVVDNGAEFHSHYFEQLLAHYACTKKHRPPARAKFGAVVERLFGTANTQLIYELQGNTQIMKNHRQVTKSVSPDKLAVWSIGDLYEALCQWAYEIYDQREHPAIGLSPRDAFSNGLVVGGKRTHLQVTYDETFHLLTLPAPERGKRKIQPSHGVKINNIYYWCNAFRDPELEKSLVDVRYDPFDASVAYAYVRGQWVKCISNYYQYLQGRTEKEIKLVTAELNRRKQAGRRKSITTDKELVRFLNSTEAKEGNLLKQRLQDVENKAVLQLIEGGLSKKSDPPELQKAYEAKLQVVSSSTQETETQTYQRDVVEEDCAPAALEYYGEF